MSYNPVYILAKVEVVGSNPIARSNLFNKLAIWSPWLVSTGSPTGHPEKKFRQVLTSPDNCEVRSSFCFRRLT